MKVANSTGREYTLLRSSKPKAAWCDKIEKPAKVKINGATIMVFANEAKSDYIYMEIPAEDGKSVLTYCVWAKDPKEFDFAKETSVKTVVKAPKVKAEAPAKTAKAPKKANTEKVTDAPKINRAPAEAANA
jgi:hypothetical protein